jgi:hypothetical protein
MRLRDDYSSPTAVRPASRGVVPDEADDEEFSPFGSSLPSTPRRGRLSLSAPPRARRRTRRRRTRRTRRTA